MSALTPLASWFLVLVAALFALAIALGIMAGRSRQHDDFMTLQWLARQRLHAEQQLYDQDTEWATMEEGVQMLDDLYNPNPRVVVCRSCRAPLRLKSAKGDWEHRSEALNRDHHATPMPGATT